MYYSLTYSAGPLVLSNPSGSNILTFSPSNTIVELLLRPRTMSREEFRVCNNRSIDDFVVSLSTQPHCRPGSSAGGFSTTFQELLILEMFLSMDGTSSSLQGPVKTLRRILGYSAPASQLYTSRGWTVTPPTFQR